MNQIFVESPNNSNHSNSGFEINQSLFSSSTPISNDIPTPILKRVWHDFTKPFGNHLGLVENLDNEFTHGDVMTPLEEPIESVPSENTQNLILVSDVTNEKNPTQDSSTSILNGLTQIDLNKFHSIK